MFCHRRLRRLTMERHMFEIAQREIYVVEAYICCVEHQKEKLVDHIRGHNVYLVGRYYMEAEKLEELLNTENHDATMTTLKELAEKKREFNRRYFELARGFMY